MKNGIFVLILLLGMVPGASAQPPFPAPQPRTDDGSQIDTLVIYTSNARAIAGGAHAQALTMIETAITGVNQALAASGIVTEINVVGYQPVFYMEQVNIDFHADLNHLRGMSDGYLDEIHALRDYYAADLVLMVTGTWFHVYTGDSTWITTPDAAEGFVVWAAKSINGIEPARWVARALGVDDTPPFDSTQTATMNSNIPAVANYRNSTDRVLPTQELLQNGGFEVDMDGNRVPDFWVASAWGNGDTRLCNKPGTQYAGVCSIKFRLESATSAIMQPASGSSIQLNDEIALAIHARTSDNACVTLQIVLKYANAPKQKSPLQTCIVSASGWTLLTHTTIATDIVITAKARIKAKGSGKLWLDEATMTVIPVAIRGGY